MRIQQYKIISFDIFDTLIKRSVAKPSDLFYLMEQHFMHKDIGEAAVGFTEKRIKAEELAYQKYGVLPNLKMIYEELHTLYGEYTKELMQFEIEMELAGCRPNHKCVEWFQHLVSEGKTIILLSDMYLSSDILRAMLDRCGVRDYKKIFVSCEHNACKSDGSLFKLVMKQMEVRPSQWIHIGDNRKADVLVPTYMGIRAVWVRNDQKKLCEVSHALPDDSAIAERTLRACVRNCSQAMTDNERMGCEIFGPLLYGFTQWLIEQLEKDKINDVYFLSRDGYVLQKAFEMIKTEKIRSHYLYCSRRSYQVPLIWKHPEFEDVIQPFIHVKRMTLREFLLRIGLDPVKYVEHASAQNLEIDYIYEKSSIFSSEKVIAFYRSIQADVEANSKAEYEALLAYIHSMNMKGAIALVDVGYHGTMQYALEELFRSEHMSINVKGYYVCVSSEAPYIREQKIQAAGYLYDENHGKNFEQIRSICPTLFEAQFLANHGSVKRFVMQNDIGIPEYDVFEYENDSGKMVDEIAIIEAYQTGALTMVRELNDAFAGAWFTMPLEVIFSAYTRLVTSPSLKEARVWGDFRYHSFTQDYIARPKCICHYFFHPSSLKRDFLMCAWKIGFMRRMLRMPLPYKKIYFFLKGKYNK